MKILVDILILYLVTSLSFFTIVGYGDIFYGKFLRKKEKEIFYIFFWGLVFLFIIQFFIYFLFKITFLSNFIIILTGLYFFYRSKNQYKKDFKIFFILLFLLIIVLVISKTHEDFKHHHYQIINGIFNQKLSLGKANLNPQFIYTPSLVYIISVFKFPNFESNFYHVVPFLTFLSFTGYLFKGFKKQNKKNDNFIFFISLIFSLIFFKSLKKYGFDASAFFFGAICLFEYIKRKKYYLDTLILFIFAISIKVTILFSIPFFVYIYAKDIIKNYKFKIIKNREIFISIFIFSLIIFAGFLDNGCIFYIFDDLCLNKNLIPWAIDSNLINEISFQTELDTKGFFTQELISDKNFYLKDFNWIIFWFKDGTSIKVLNFIFIYFLCFIIVILFNKVQIKSKFKICDLLLSFVCLIFWFLSLPTLRYGYLPIFLSLFFINYTFLNFKNNKILNKNFIIIFCLIILNLHNFNRIFKEFNRVDANYFNNFPWYYLPDRKVTIKTNMGGKIYEKNDNIIYPCWNVPWPCWEAPKEILISEKKYYVMYKIK